MERVLTQTCMALPGAPPPIGRWAVDSAGETEQSAQGVTTSPQQSDIQVIHRGASLSVTQREHRHLVRKEQVARAGCRPAAVPVADLKASTRLSRHLSAASYFDLGWRLVGAAASRRVQVAAREGVVKARVDTTASIRVRPRFRVRLRQLVVSGELASCADQ